MLYNLVPGGCTMSQANQTYFKGKRQILSKDRSFYIKNEIYIDEYLSRSLLTKIPHILPNLSKFEMKDDRAVYISPVVVGKNMTQLQDISSSAKIELIHKYLKLVASLKKLPISLQISLLRLENFYLSENELIHRGVLIVEDIDFTRNYTIYDLNKAISEQMIQFISNDLSLINFKTYFRNLANAATPYTMDQIIEAVNKLYINDLFEKNKFESKIPKTVEKKSKPLPIDIKYIISSVLILTMLFTFTFAFIRSIDTTRYDLPQAKFEIIRQNQSYIALNKSFSDQQNLQITAAEWKLYKGGTLIQTSSADNFNFTPEDDSTYYLELVVKDNRGISSEIFRRTIDTQPVSDTVELMDNFDYGKATFTTETFYEGTKSAILHSPNDELLIHNVYLNKTIHGSFMIRAKADGEVTFIVNGYANGKTISSTEKTFKVTHDTWKLIEFGFSSEEITGLQMIFQSKDNTLFVDNLTLGSH